MQSATMRLYSSNWCATRPSGALELRYDVALIVIKLARDITVGAAIPRPIGNSLCSICQNSNSILSAISFKQIFERQISRICRLDQDQHKPSPRLCSSFNTWYINEELVAVRVFPKERPFSYGIRTYYGAATMYRCVFRKSAIMLMRFAYFESVK